MAKHEQQGKAAERKEHFLAMANLIGRFGAGAFANSKPQQLNVTMDAEEIHQVDLMVEQGLYASRKDFLQLAARNLLREHGVEVPRPMTGELKVAGIAVHNRKSLEKLRAAGRQLELNVTGIFRLADDVTPELACAVIKSLTLRGTFEASAEVKATLKDRTH
jgi:Arc/MetJ-type ribon-helix-helix transcriptional regulator